MFSACVLFTSLIIDLISKHTFCFCLISCVENYHQQLKTVCNVELCLKKIGQNNFVFFLIFIVVEKYDLLCILIIVRFRV